MRRIQNILVKLHYYFFFQGHQRSIEAKKNILLLGIIKVVSVLTSLAIVPLTINYINPVQYGIWLTLSSIVSWFSIFDIGFGNGLRNKFVEAKVNGNNLLARTLVSTTYASLLIIFSSIWFIFFLLNLFVKWNILLNAPIEMNYELTKLALIVFTFFCMQMVLKTINSLFLADQKPAKSALLDLIGQIISLLIIVILSKSTSGSLINLGITLGLVPTIVLLISSLWFFTTSYSDFAPSFSYIRLSGIKVIMNLGFSFFIIQIASLILFQSNNIIIAQLFGPENVTPYNISFRYFGIIPMIFGIILTPFWSSFTEAWFRNDVEWIKIIIKKLKFVWIALTFLTFMMLIFSKQVYEWWVGKEITIPASVSILLTFYVVINAWNSIFTNFINGLGKIKLQLYSAIWCSFLNIPMSIILGRNLGIAGVILSTVILSLINMIWITIQYNKLINNKAKGIWAR